MKTLNLNIEDEVRVELYAIMLCDVISKLLLLLKLNSVELLNEVFINLVIKLRKLIKISYPLCANLIRDKFRKLWVAESKPTTLCNTICLVLESFWIDSIPILENIVLEDFCMNPSNTVCIA